MIQSKNSKGKVGPKIDLKLKHSFNDQILPLRDFLYSVHLSLFKNAPVAQSFSDFVANGILHEGRPFLSKYKDLYIQGLKLLSTGEGDFTGFSLTANGFPKHYEEIFQRLFVFHDTFYKYAFTNCRRVDDIKENIRNNRTVLVTLLSLLRWPYMVTIEMSDHEKAEKLEAFKTLITSFKPGDKEYYSGLLANRLADEHLLSVIGLQDEISYETSLEGDGMLARQVVRPKLSERTYKGRSDRIGTIPRCVAYMNDIMVNPLYIDDSPLGKTTVLSEKGGKTRFIVGYTGLVNGTGVYEYFRRILDGIPGDSSSDQTKGHERARRLSEYSLNSIISADLSSFTDGLTTSVLYPFLDRLGLHDFIGVINAPIYVGDSVVKPVRPLMGLRGTFEIASIIHHVVARECDIKDYSLCGDDMVFEKGSYESYVRVWNSLGIEVNPSKTIVAKGMATFCGKVYLFGIDISPVTIPFNSISKINDRHELLTTCSQVIENSKAVIKPVFHKIVSIVLRLLNRKFKNQPLPKHLPRKLGGLGLPGGPGLLKVLAKPWVHSFIILPDLEEPPDAYVTRRYLPLVDPDEIRLFPWLSNLLCDGYYTNKKKVRVKRPVKNLGLKDLVSVLEYFYSIGQWSPT